MNGFNAEINKVYIFILIKAFIGNEHFQKQNWNGVQEKGCLNGNDCYSGCPTQKELWLPTIWLPHPCGTGFVMASPAGLTEDVQHLIANFFCSRRHWLKAPLYSFCVKGRTRTPFDTRLAKTAAFRLQTAQKLLYGCIGKDVQRYQHQVR